MKKHADLLLIEQMCQIYECSRCSRVIPTERGVAKEMWIRECRVIHDLQYLGFASRYINPKRRHTQKWFPTRSLERPRLNPSRLASPAVSVVRPSTPSADKATARCDLLAHVVGIWKNPSGRDDFPTSKHGRAHDD